MLIADKILRVFGLNGELWVKHLTVMPKGYPLNRFTLAGAIRYASLNRTRNDMVMPFFLKANGLVMDAICEDLGYEESITFFNDHIANDFSDIVRILDRVREMEPKRRKAA